jgi:hypothetical protein
MWDQAWLSNGFDTGMLVLWKTVDLIGIIHSAESRTHARVMFEDVGLMDVNYSSLERVVLNKQEKLAMFNIIDGSALYEDARASRINEQRAMLRLWRRSI